MVPPKTLRQIFNKRKIHEQAKSGELETSVQKERHAPAKARQPICTQSQYVVYRNSEGDKVAEAHQYLTPDGTVGGSGKPDPKRMVIDGEFWVAAPE
jgi:hypothetical protein